MPQKGLDRPLRWALGDGLRSLVLLSEYLLHRKSYLSFETFRNAKAISNQRCNCLYLLKMGNRMLNGFIDSCFSR